MFKSSEQDENDLLRSAIIRRKMLQTFFCVILDQGPYFF
jgi:hypothetical protein